MCFQLSFRVGILFLKLYYDEFDYIASNQENFETGIVNNLIFLCPNIVKEKEKKTNVYFLRH